MGVEFPGGAGGGGGALTSVAGHLAADGNLAAAATTAILSTTALGVGKWLINFSADMVNNLGGAGTLEVETTLGTAVATFEGQQSGAGALFAADTGQVQVELCFIATITTAGTLTFSAANSSAVIVIVKAATLTNAFAKATGWTAVKIG